MMIGIEEGLTEITGEVEDEMDETGEIDAHGEEMAENRPVESLLIFRIQPHLERRTNIDMSRKHIDVSVDMSGTMSVDLTVIIIMVIPRARVIGLRLTNELDEIDTIMIVLDLLLLHLALISVRHQQLLNLLLDLIFPIPD